MVYLLAVVIGLGFGLSLSIAPHAAVANWFEKRRSLSFALLLTGPILVILVGHSMGGMTAMLFALDHQDKVSKLVLAGTAAKQAFFMRIFLWSMMHILPYESFARFAIDLKYHKPSEKVKKEALDRALKTPRYAAKKSFAEWSKNYDIRERVSKIKAPALIVVGDRDRATPVEMSIFLNREIVGSKMRIMRGSNHMLMIDKPGELNAIIEEFIRQV